MKFKNKLWGLAPRKAVIVSGVMFVGVVAFSLYREVPIVEPVSGEEVPVVVAEEPSEVLEEYQGPLHHIFFHSLIIYPEQAAADSENWEGYKSNMITTQQFKRIIQQLYEHNFVLIEAETLYSFGETGELREHPLFLPKGKKPLILSIDDLSYYSYMQRGGFARKLVLHEGAVQTEIVTPAGDTEVTSDGDAVPILETFIAEHPDFSFRGARGIIGLTGFEGILGYRTNWKGVRGDRERAEALRVVKALKNSGWTFASHSFSHDQGFLRGTVTLSFLAQDILRWKEQVEPLVGPTNVFIGPFGQIFKADDPRRQALMDAGFKVFYGVGMDGYTHFSDNDLVMNRTDIDGYRLEHNAAQLRAVYGISLQDE